MLKLFKKADLILLASLLLIASFFIVFPILLKGKSPEGQELFARITVDGKLYKTVALSAAEQELEIRTKYGYNLLKLHDGGIQMIKADCPDRLCLTFGAITSIGQTIVCLPNRLMVEVVSGTGGGGGLDGVAS
ncbi:NusG domain II-containing protein [Paenibacillus sp. YN15]|uniref:NusG domain II-containing protein n=1 Tax=Paenibacillus sp. YN15 TaxID=1742774 RepID=UPI000DCC3E51|nr:NusG domain II-containing protein [Paenibacillus sp. YN15]RAV04757.1 NusG domain II-containing protein [Paenibacillus sp. YN15]